MAMPSSKAAKMRKKRVRRATMMTSDDGEEFVGAHEDIESVSCRHWIPPVSCHNCYWRGFAHLLLAALARSVSLLLLPWGQLVQRRLRCDI